MVIINTVEDLQCGYVCKPLECELCDYDLEDDCTEGCRNIINSEEDEKE